MDNYNFEPSLRESNPTHRERAQAAMLLNGFSLKKITEVFQSLEEFTEAANGSDLEGCEKYLWDSAVNREFL